MTEFLDPLDGAFILLEVAGSSMNIGAVVELEPGDFDANTRFELIRATVAARVHEIPVFTKRVVRAPLDMTWPILVPDERIDLDRHVIRAAVPGPGTDEQFDVLVSDFFSRALNPRRPLWQLLVIEGLSEGRSALVLKVHHALADGVSGAEAFANLFDISPEIRAPAPAVETPQDDTVTSSFGLLAQGLRRIRTRPAIVLESLTSWSARLYRAVRAFVIVTLSHAARRSGDEQPSIFEARRTSLNGAPGVEKEFHRLRLPLADVKRAAKSRGASVTDFVMATSSGALRRLLEHRGETARRDLVAFVPINVRDETSAQLGNQISGKLIRLHTELTDPLERLDAIVKDSAAAAGRRRADNEKVLQSIPRVLGPMALSIGAKLVSLTGVVSWMPPIANVMISSVPGPPISLWLSGLRVVSAAPVGPLVGSFSLNVTVLGFGESLEFGLLGCALQMPDLELLRDLLVEEANQLINATPR